MHHLAAGGYSGYIGGLSELPDHHEIHRAVHRLQEQRQEYRKGKPQQGTFDKASSLFHKKNLL